METINKLQVNDVDYDIVGKELTKITYADLKALRDNGKLLEGHFYRITDYSGPLDGAEHSFDIITQALSSNTLSENAKAIQNEDNDYFNNNNLNAWKLKYCLDGDDKRFANPYFIFQGIMVNDPENGEQLYFSNISPRHQTPYWEYTTDPSTEESTITLYEEFKGMKATDDKYFYRGVVTVDGVEYDCWQKWELKNLERNNSDGFTYDDWVFGEGNAYVYYLSTRVVFNNKIVFPIAQGIIYYMKDEFGNEANYDFKNTLFNSKYTFSRQTEDLEILDHSLSPNCKHNIIHIPTGQNKNGIVLQVFEEDGKMSNNTFQHDCIDIELTSYDIYKNSFGDDCFSISLNADGSIYNNTIGKNCGNIILDSCDDSFCNNTFGDGCVDITINGNVYMNVLGAECYNIQLNGGCHNNIIGSYCDAITLGTDNTHNAFKNGCYNIQFGNNNSQNTCGTSCENVELGNDNTNIRLKNSCKNIILQSNCTKLTFEDDVFDLNLPYDYLDNIQFKKDCHNITFSLVTSTKNSPLKNIIIGPSIHNEEVHFESGIDAECVLTKNSNGETVQFYLSDLVQ